MDPDDDDPDDIQGALSVALPGVAKRVTKAGGRIGVARLVRQHIRQASERVITRKLVHAGHALDDLIRVAFNFIKNVVHVARFQVREGSHIQDGA